MKSIDLNSISSKEEIYNYYVKDNHSQAECVKYFEVSNYTWNKLIHLYNIIKPKDKIKERIKKTNIIKYGVEYVSQNKEIGKKLSVAYNKKTDKEKLNIKEKVKNTNLKKYGVSTYSKLEECKEKVKDTNLKKYGVDNIAKSPTYIEKKKQTCLLKYGDKNYTNKNQANKTIQTKYGVSNFGEMCQLEEIKTKKQTKIKEKYGVDYFTESFFENYDKKYKEIYHNKEKSVTYLKSHPKHTVKEWSNIFKCPFYSVTNWIATFNLSSYIKNEKSHFEEEIIGIISNIIPNEEIIHNDRKILGNGQEIDIYVPKYKIGIEFNGNYWHSSLYLNKYYHINKSKLAESKGIRLIHIWEYEWIKPSQQAKIILMLKEAFNKTSNVIYARKCNIRQITNKEASILNNKIHLQGHKNAQVTYGLFYENKLVQLMSFSRSKYNRNLKDNNSWEIIRGCPGSNSRVVGGVSKLFKHFIRDYNPNYVFSYCDFNKFNGVSYKKLGMKLIGYTCPDMKWLLKGGVVVNRNPNKHKEIKENSIAQLYGSGSKKYLWTKDIEER